MYISRYAVGAVRNLAVSRRGREALLDQPGVCLCMHVSVFSLVCVCVCAHKRMHVGINMYTLSHTYTRTNTHTICLSHRRACGAGGTVLEQRPDGRHLRQGRH